MVTSRSVSLFPIPIGLYNFGKENHQLNINLVNDILIESSEDIKGSQRSNLGGWHSKNSLEERYDSFVLLREKIEESINDYCLKNGFVGGLTCGGLWSNINESGDMNVAHHHGNSCLTGCYYPCESIIDDKVNFNYTDASPLFTGMWDGNSGGSLCFQDPSFGLKTRLKKGKNPNPCIIDHYHLYPTAGLLVVFPSYIIHSVIPFRENKRRLSISFDSDYGMSS